MFQFHFLSSHRHKGDCLRLGFCQSSSRGPCQRSVSMLAPLPPSNESIFPPHLPFPLHPPYCDIPGGYHSAGDSQPGNGRQVAAVPPTAFYKENQYFFGAGFLGDGATIATCSWLPHLLNVSFCCLCATLKGNDPLVPNSNILKWWLKVTIPRILFRGGYNTFHYSVRPYTFSGHLGQREKLCVVLTCRLDVLLLFQKP